jgi:predicted amino acid-binding ACT domain protein
MKSQFATVDPSKQTVRFAKLKKEITDAGKQHVLVHMQNTSIYLL